MKYRKLNEYILILFLIFCFQSHAASTVYKYILDNQLTVLIHKTSLQQSVSTQLWVKVGSKHEQLNEKGLAHLLEHEAFKGTQSMSEADVSRIVGKLSGYCNATTSFDWTRFYFNFPQQHWHYSLQLLADIFTNCTFKQDLLNAELKVVIQELKMNRDKFGRHLFQILLSTLFPDHPYHYPVIGYKHHLWNLTRENLENFYKKYYQPQNAVLVIVGNVEPEETIARVRTYFETISNTNTQEIPTFKPTAPELVNHSVTLYRDIHQPYCLLAFRIPGLKDDSSYIWDAATLILTQGKNSRLGKKLVEKLQLVSSVSSYNLGLFDQDLFLISFQPFKQEDIDIVIEEICTELNSLAQNGPTREEISHVCRKLSKQFYEAKENNYVLASAIAESFLATGNENIVFEEIRTLDNLIEFQKKVHQACASYLNSLLMHTGFVLPLRDGDAKELIEIQQNSDKEDTAILSGIVRESHDEPTKLAHTILPTEPKSPIIPQVQSFTLANGLHVQYFHNPYIPMITIALNLKAQNDYVPDHLEGLYTMVCAMMKEGTTKRTGLELAHLLDSHAISLSINPGLLTMNLLSQDLEKGLEILNELVTCCTFPQESFGKIRQAMLMNYKNFLDDPASIANYLSNFYLYKGHPWRRNNIGTPETLKKITRDDLVNFYKNYISPDDATLIIVGDLSNVDVKKIMPPIFESWQYFPVPTIVYPKLNPITATTINHYIERDQIVLAFSGLSVDRNHEDFDALLLFDYMLTGGMNSKLFKLRQKTGAFYSIQGSVLEGSGKQPGVAFVSTLVSQDRIQEAEKLIRNFIETVSDDITQEDVNTARNTFGYQILEGYSNNNQIVNTLHFLKKYSLPFDYFLQKIEKLKKITVDQIKEAVKKIFRLDSMITIKVGRISA